MTLIIVMFSVKYKLKLISKGELKCSIPLTLICIFITIQPEVL